jgi:hypothetical protein
VQAGHDADAQAIADAQLDADATPAGDAQMDGSEAGSGLLGTGTMSDPYRQASPLPDCLAYQHAYGSTAHDGYYSIAPHGGTPFTDLCSMSVNGGGWTLLIQQYASALGSAQRNYLYLFNGHWYESPTTSLIWSWSSAQQLTGTYPSFDGNRSLQLFARDRVRCPASASDARTERVPRPRYCRFSRSVP